MLMNVDYTVARQMLLDNVQPVGTETVPLEECAGRVLAQELTASENVPPFDRSAFDGYAFKSDDTRGASHEAPVELRLLEEVPAGSVPTMDVTSGTATKILTGAPIPDGADAVINHEAVSFTSHKVTLFAPVKRGANIVLRGEDVCAGQMLAQTGDYIDAGLAGTLAAQGVTRPLVYRLPVIGVLSTGSEVVEPAETPGPGKIRNSNRFTLDAALKNIGCRTRYYGIAGDTVPEISELMERALSECDAIVMTGGVSAGDYDLTPAAMEHIGATLLLRGMALKPGMACAYAVRDGKLLCGQSGNPASFITGFYAVTLPALKKLSGRREFIPEEINVALGSDFKKSSKTSRLLRGKLDLSSGCARILLPAEQGNVVLSSTIGCNVMAIIPAGSGPQSAGTILKGFLI